MSSTAPRTLPVGLRLRLGGLAVQLVGAAAMFFCLLVPGEPPVLLWGWVPGLGSRLLLGLAPALPLVALGWDLRRRARRRAEGPILRTRWPRMAWAVGEAVAWSLALGLLGMTALAVLFMTSQSKVLEPVSPGGCRVVVAEEEWLDISGNVYVLDGPVGLGRHVGRYWAETNAGSALHGRATLTWDGEQGTLSIPEAMDGKSIPVSCR